VETAFAPAGSDDCNLPRPEFGRGLRAALQLACSAEAPPLLDEPISPELALVSPELRTLAIATLPDRDPDGFLPRRRPLYLVEVLDIDDAAVQPPPEGRRHGVVIAAAAYLAVEAAQIAVVGAAVMGSLAGVITLATWLHG
jgi:hypothetical protein